MCKSYALLAIPMIAFSILATSDSALGAGSRCDQFKVGAMESNRGIVGTDELDGSYRLTDSYGSSCRTFVNGVSTLTNVQDKFSATFVGTDLITMYSMAEGDNTRLEFEYNQEGSKVKVTLYQPGKLPETDLMDWAQVNELALLVTGHNPQPLDNPPSEVTPAD
jgi:hypothetical protein